MRRSCLTGLNALVVGGLACVGHVRGQEAELFTALKHERLFAALELKVERPHLCRATEFGLHYPVDSSALPLKTRAFVLGVHPSRQAAEQAVERALRRAQVSPSDPSGYFAGVGDVRYLWSGTLIFLRDNITVAFWWAGEKEDALALALARRVDELIRTDREIAPRGRFTQTPEIVSTGAPTTMAKTTRTTITPTVRGLPPEPKPTLQVIDLDQGHNWHWNDRPKPGDTTLHLVAPKHAQAPSGERRLLLVASNEDNLFVAKEFTIDLTE